jgi:hypothetical protein
MDILKLTGSNAIWAKPLRGLVVMGLALIFAAPQARAAMLFDGASVTSTRFALAEGSIATGIKLTLNGLHLPGEPYAQSRSLAFEVFKIGMDAENVAIAVSGSDRGLPLHAAQLVTFPDGEAPRFLITSKDATGGSLAAKVQALDPQGQAVLATICVSLTDPTTVAAALGHLAKTDRPAPEGLFQTAVLSLAAECRSALAKTGTTSGGFINRDKLPTRLLNSADGLLSAESIAFENYNYMAETSGNRYSGSMPTFRVVEVIGPNSRLPPKTFAVTSLPWAGNLYEPFERRIGLYGRVAQYPNAVSGLFDASDDLAIDLWYNEQPPQELDAAIADSSRESLILVDHVLSNLPVLRATALETSTAAGISIDSVLSSEAAAYWSIATFGDDVSAVLDKVHEELFRRSYPDENAVRALQESLTKWQLYDGAVDGKTGPKTRSAFADFERMVSGAANGTPSELELAALPLWSEGPPPAPPALAGSLADALTQDQPADGTAGAAVKLRDMEREADGILSEIADLEAELAAVDSETTAKIHAVETLLSDCYCQGGRLCP